MSSSETPTQALEPVEVSQAARKAASALIAWHNKAASDWKTDGGSDLRFFAADMPDAINKGVWDSHDVVQAFARFERDTIERHRQSSNAASVGSFRDHLNAVLDTSGARGTYHALRYTEAVEAAERALASLSTPTAEPMADLQRLGQEYDGDALEGPFHVSRSSNGEKQWFSARDPAAGVTIPGNDRADAYALVAALNRSCAMFARRALSATPAPAVDETDRLRAEVAGYRKLTREQQQRITKLEGALMSHPPIKPDYGSWWYPEGDTSSDACCHGPSEALEGPADEMEEGEARMVVLERAIALPDVYAALRVFTDAEMNARGDDEQWDFTLHATAEEARAALSDRPQAEEEVK